MNLEGWSRVLSIVVGIRNNIYCLGIRDILGEETPHSLEEAVALYDYMLGRISSPVCPERAPTPQPVPNQDGKPRDITDDNRPRRNRFSSEAKICWISVFRGWNRVALFFVLRWSPVLLSAIRPRLC